MYSCPPPPTKKEKKALKLSRNRLCKVSCFLIKNLERGVPRGNYRLDLKRNGNEVILEIKRAMSILQVRNALLQSFKISDFKILSCADGKFVESDTQAPDGNYIMETIGGGKSSMYILEINKVNNSVLFKAGNLCFIYINRILVVEPILLFIA